jgi:hypothetical protein
MSATGMAIHDMMDTICITMRTSPPKRDVAERAVGAS